MRWANKVTNNSAVKSKSVVTIMDVIQEIQLSLTNRVTHLCNMQWRD